MSEPAKDEAELAELAELVERVSHAIWENCDEGVAMDSIAISAIAAIRAAWWAVVPIKPTREMLRAGYDESGGRSVIGIWEAMLEAAPEVKP